MSRLVTNSEWNQALREGACRRSSPRRGPPASTESFVDVDQALSRARDRGRPTWSQRSQLQEAARALDLIARGGPKRFFFAGVIDELLLHAHKPEVSAAFRERCRRLFAMWAELGALGRLSPHGEEAPFRA
ncbi:hypothetical protein BC567DRAFT_299125 [Phyllosticta citribraziliensis]